MDAIVKFFQQGGNLMLLNLGVMFFGIAVIVERGVKLAKYGIREKEFTNGVEMYLRSGNLEAAAQAASTTAPRSWRRRPSRSSR